MILIIHDDDKHGYYDAFARYDGSEELEPMRLFLRQQAERTWEKSLEQELRRCSGLDNKK